MPQKLNHKCDRKAFKQQNQVFQTILLQEMASGNAEQVNHQILEHINKILSNNVINPSFATVFLPLLVEASSIIGSNTRAQVKDAETQTDENNETGDIGLDNLDDVMESNQPENSSNIPGDVTDVSYAQVDPEHTNLEPSENIHDKDWDLIFQLENWKRNNILNEVNVSDCKDKVKTVYEFDPYCTRGVPNRRRWERSPSSTSSCRSRSRSRSRSPSSRRRKRSPGFLERRRITSARKLPVVLIRSGPKQKRSDNRRKRSPSVSSESSCSSLSRSRDSRRSRGLTSSGCRERDKSI